MTSISRQFKCGLRSALFAATAVFLAATSSFNPASAQDLNKDEVGEIVREYLLENPEVIMEALNELQRRQDEAQELARREALTSNAGVLFDSTRQVVLGNPEGSVTVVEFFDYNCGYCKRAYGDMVRLIEANPDLRVVLKEFPILGPESQAAATVAVAVNSVAPDKYLQFHETLLLGRGVANQDSAMQAALAAGVNEDDLMAAMQTDEAQRTFEEVGALAQSLGLNGTPAYVVGEAIVPGAVGYDQLQALVDAEANCGETTC
ncbi:DsbA family protein [Roseibium denhamense]|uniref:Protein-disulfide isomerase n=1 Tax=Roseibium denhamense TaxID=76305 RepID=A0ABY1PJD3_9HYPH|nr:DsbA family protein [Roseibium denhamense]MTI04993.1 DsbA family protein [Roseibium denhamense]SMP33264.1 Protein-disulfide isomerase [Roseibium denhamense]